MQYAFDSVLQLFFVLSELWFSFLGAPGLTNAFEKLKVHVNRKFATVFTSALWRTSERNRILNEENRGHD